MVKKALYAVLALIVVASAIIVGVQLRQRASEENIEVAVEEETERQLGVLQKQQPGMFTGTRGKMAQESYKRAIEQQVKLNEMIIREALDRGITVAANEIDIAIAQVRQAYASEKKFDDALKKQGWTLEKYRENIKDQIIMSKMVKEITKDITVTDAEIKAYYKANKAQFGNKPLSKVYDQVKQTVLQQKKKERYNEFIKEMEEKLQ